MEKKLGIVILNYNNYQVTIDCVNSIFKQQYTNYEIIIVDNGSNNNSSSILKENFASYGNVKILSLENNIGYAKGNNAGIDYLRKIGCNYIMLCNSDIIFNCQDTFTALLNCNDSRVGVINPLVLTTDNIYNIFVYYKRKLFFPHMLLSLLFEEFKHIFKLKQKRRPLSTNFYKEQIDESFCITGCLYILTPSFFEYYNGIFEKTYLFMEEWATIVLLYKAKLITKTIANLNIVHLQAKSTSSGVLKEKSKLERKSIFNIILLLLTPRKLLFIGTK